MAQLPTAAKAKVSLKHEYVAKNSTRMIVATAVASALAMFAIFGGHSILSRMSYQRHVIAQQHIAVNQLKSDINSLQSLVNQYKIFSTANPNMLGGSSSGTSGDEGSNARIALDALPS